MKKFALATALTAGFALSNAALAEAQLTNTAPAMGEMLMGAPSELVMTFDGPVVLMELSLTDDAGNNTVIEVDDSSAATFTFELDTLSPQTYTVNWIAVGEDQEVAEGDYWFMVH